MHLGLEGKVVVITGATANIGRAITLDFATEGAAVVAVGRDEEAGQRVVDDAISRGAKAAIFVRADLLESESPAKILTAAGSLGPVDILVNNVGGNVGAGFFADSDPATWQGDLDISFMTTLRMTHATLPGMIQRKSGRIINMGSTAGIVGDYMQAVYSASKSAIHGFTRVLAKELGQYGITVNCVAPWGTFSEDPAAYSRGSRFHPDNDFFGRALPDLTEFDKRMRMRRGVLERPFARPQEVSAAVLYLASDRASFVTGQILTVDGGTLL